MATRSKPLTLNLEDYDVPSLVQNRTYEIDDNGNTTNSTDQSKIYVYCRIEERERVDGSKEITGGDEVKLLKFDVRCQYDLELYTALRSEHASFEFDGEVNEVANVTLWPSYARPQEIRFVCHHGSTDFSKQPS